MRQLTADLKEGTLPLKDLLLGIADNNLDVLVYLPEIE